MSDKFWIGVDVFAVLYFGIRVLTYIMNRGI
jgi:hypothetical protein